MRGRKGPDHLDEAKRCAASMGYHWAENTDTAVPFHGFLFRKGIVIAVKLKKVRYGLDADSIIENKYPDDIADLRTLPLPPFIVRELWVRTQNERAYRRFYVMPDSTAEIEVNTADNYRNTHFRETYWKNAPYRIDITLTEDGEIRVNGSQKSP